MRWTRGAVSGRWPFDSVNASNPTCSSGVGDTIGAKKSLVCMVAVMVAAAALTSSEEARWFSARDTSGQPTVSCDDITKLDLRNTTIQSRHRIFAFHHGFAETGPVEPVPGKSPLQPQ